MIQALYVDPKSAGMGLGAKLFDLVNDYAINKGKEKLHLKASLNAITFYQKMGFVSVREEQQNFSDGCFMPALLMQKHEIKIKQ